LDFFLFSLLRRKNKIKKMMPSPHNPPTTPPAMVLVWFPLGAPVTLLEVSLGCLNFVVVPGIVEEDETEVEVEVGAALFSGESDLK
jgi:hypothetical protein